MLPSCAALQLAGPSGRVGSGRLASARVRGHCGLWAARAPQDWRAAPRPPLGPHCVRRKKLRDDVPLFPALPALSGCHRDIASPCTAPNCPDRPAGRPPRKARANERTRERPLLPWAGQQQASAKPGPTSLNGPLQPPRSRARIAIGRGACLSVPSFTSTGSGACPSLSSGRTHLPPWLSLVAAPPAPPPEIGRAHV